MSTEKICPQCGAEYNAEQQVCPRDGASLRIRVRRIFISHSAHDRERIEREIISPLREHGLETWYSREDIQGAAAWERSIREALNRCDWFLVAMSPRAVASEWVQAEVHWALEHRPGQVVPVLLEPCDATQLHLKLSRLQHIDFTDNPSEGLDRLLAVWGIRSPGTDASRRLAPRPRLTQPRVKAGRGLAWLSGRRLALLIIVLLFGAATLALMLDLGGVIGDSRDGGMSVSEGSAVRRLELLLPDSAPLAFVGSASLGVGRTALTISPDGSRLVYVAQRSTTTQLYLRQLDQIEATPLPGTEGAYQPFFSPDGEWIGFFAQSQLKKVSVNGGPPVTLAAVAHASGGSWAQNGRILIAYEQGGRQLSWVPSGGGTPQPIPRALIIPAQHPELLPDGQSILHGAPDGALSLSSLTTGQWYAITNEGVVPRETVDASRLLYGSNPRYLESGHISYISRDGVLMVLAFDLDRRKVLSPPVPILEGVRIEAAVGGAQFTVSRGGTFVYAPGANLRHSVFVWVDHATGQMDTLPFPRAAYGAFELAPDGQRILVRIEPASAPAELWVLDLTREERTRVPTTGIVRGASWWPDGDHIVYPVVSGSAADRLSGVTVRQSLADPTRLDTLVRQRASSAIPSPKGTHFATGAGSGSLKLISFPGLRDTVALPRGVGPVFSPDGQWLAYVASEPEFEVYVIPIDRPRERYKVSAAGGEEPVWMPNGRGLIYRNGQQWFSVDVSTERSFRASRPRVLFQGPYLQVPGNSHQVSADGRRQLLLLGSTEQTARRLVVITNWLAEVNRAQSSEPGEQRRRTP